MDLTDQQWTIIEPLFEEKRRLRAAAARGATRVRCSTGSCGSCARRAWLDLPDRYPPYQTCHRRFHQWRKNGVFRDLLTCLTEDLLLRGKIDLTEGFIAAGFTRVCGDFLSIACLAFCDTDKLELALPAGEDAREERGTFHGRFPSTEVKKALLCRSHSKACLLSARWRPSFRGLCAPMVHSSAGSDASTIRHHCPCSVFKDPRRTVLLCERLRNITQQDRELNSWAFRSFRDVADGDYIAARMPCRAQLPVQFLWASQQALEKDLECALFIRRNPRKVFKRNAMSDGDEDRRLVAAFEAAEIPDCGFHHAEHVRVAWWYLCRHPLPEALTRFSAALRSFAAARNKPGLYHETITVACVLLINERLEATGREGSWTTFAAQHPDLLTWAPSILDRYYSPATLRSERARRRFVMPDRPGTWTRAWVGLSDTGTDLRP